MISHIVACPHSIRIKYKKIEYYPFNIELLITLSLSVFNGQKSIDIIKYPCNCQGNDKLIILQIKTDPKHVILNH